MGSFFTELKRRNVIRIASFYGAGAWLVLQVADVLLELLDAPDGSLRLVAIILALGFPFALLLAWVFEITPEGIKRESLLDRNERDTVRTSGKLDIATIGLLIVAILMLAWNQFSGRDPGGADSPGPQDLSIAVLPFVNLSVDPENEYFSEGLSEELLNVLARIDDFRVAGRTSSFAFKGQQQDLRAIGERLGVANILEGSVRKQGDQIRVTAQLIDTRSGYHLWSDTYDRRLDDVFAIQDEIATEVVRALKQALLAADETVIQQTAKGDVEAYNHYLRGQFHVRLRTREGLERALEEFQQASLIDPDYAPPYAGIAMVYALLDNYNYRSLEETGELANGALDRALALDPQSDEAWAVRGLLLGQGPGAAQRKNEARAALERAIEINPNNAHAHFWLSGLLAPDLEAMRAALRRAYQLDPLSPVIIYRRAMEALQEGDPAELARFQRELETVAPDWFMTWQAAGTSLRDKGDIAQAALAFERVVALNSEYANGVLALAGTLDLLGYRDRAEALLTEFLRRSPHAEYRLNLAALRARRVLPEGGFGAALEIYGPAVEAVDMPKAEAVAEMALLEIGAGKLADAERRLRDWLGIEHDEALPPPEPDTVVVHMAFATLFAAQGRQEELARAGDQVRAMFNEMRAGGLRLSHMPIVEGMLDHLEGQPGALEAGLRDAIAQGFRAPPEVLVWYFPLDAGTPEMAHLTTFIEEGLAEERRRYEAARAGG